MQQEPRRKGCGESKGSGKSEVGKEDPNLVLHSLLFLSPPAPEDGKRKDNGNGIGKILEVTGSGRSREKLHNIA